MKKVIIGLVVCTVISLAMPSNAFFSSGVKDVVTEALPREEVLNHQIYLENSLTYSTYRRDTTPMPKTSLGDVLGATVQESMEFNVTGMVFDALRQDPESEMLTPEQANKEYKVGDLIFNRPVSRLEAQRLSNKKLAEMRRADIYARGPQGIGVSVAQIFTAFPAFIVDPLGIALSMGVGRPAVMVVSLPQVR